MNEAAEEKVGSYKLGIGHMRELLPEVAEAYNQFSGECFKEGTLTAKEKQLIALGISLFANNEVCTYYHVNEAIHKGVTAQQIMETVAVAGAIGGGYSLSQGVTRVIKAIESSKPLPVS